MRRLAREPFPLGPTWDGQGTNFSLFSENAERVELCLFDDADGETRVELTSGRAQLARLSPRRRAGPALRLPGARALGARAGPSLQPEQAPDRSVREGDRGPGALGPGRTLAVRRRRRRSIDRDDERRRCGDPEVGRDRRVDSTGSEDSCSGAAVGRDGDLRAARQGLHAAACRGVREDLRGTYAGLASEAAIAHLLDLGVTAVELLPIHHIADEHALQAKGLTNYWGYSTIGFLAPARRLRRHGNPRRAGARVQGDGEGAPPRGHRGDPRRRLQPHRGGQPPRPDAVLQGGRQPLLLPHDAGRPPLLHGLHRHRQLAQPRAPRCCG